MDARATPVEERPLRLALELRRIGLPREDALRMAARLISSHPLTRRVGLPGLARWLRRAGVGDAEAREAAALLFALDGLDLGLRFGQVLRELGEVGVAPALAQGAALEASRIHRASPLRPSQALLPPSLVLGALATTALLLAVTILMALSG